MQNDRVKEISPGPLPVTAIYDISHKEKTRNYSSRPGRHSVHELIYVDYGEIVLFYDERTLSLKTGDCILIPGGTNHHFYGMAGKPFDFLNMTFSGEIVESGFGQIIKLTIDERQLLQKLKQEIEERASCFHEMVFLIFNAFIVSLQRHKDYVESVEFAGENSLNYRRSIVKKILNHLSNNYSQPLSVRSVCKLSGLSSSYIRVLMKQETGKSLTQHLKEIRVAMAKRLIRESADNVNMIAYKVGYQSVPHFCTVFKGVSGKTPSEYAKSLK